MCARACACVKQCYVTKFSNSGSIVPTDIHKHLMNIYGDITVNVSTIRHVGGNDSRFTDMPMSSHPHTHCGDSRKWESESTDS